MPGFEYTILMGDTLSQIAQRYRIEGGWQFIWHDSHNDRLRALRGTPNQLYPGDRVFIPGAEGNVCETASGGTARFTAPPPYRICAEDGTSPPPTAIPVGGSIVMKAVHDEYVGEGWRWGTNSTKITLSNELTDTVTITAGENASAAIASECIHLTFEPGRCASDETAEEAEEAATQFVVTYVSVISVAFSASPAHAYGFDGMGANADDPTPDGETPHLSVAQNEVGKVQVAIAGGVGGGVLHFTSDDGSIAEADPHGTPPAEFTLSIRAKSQEGVQTLIHARANSEDGPICASLAVNVYMETSYSAKVFKAWDSASSAPSPGTALARPSFLAADTQTAVRSFFKQAVTTINLTDGGLLDVNFDPTGAGALVLEAGRTSAGEQAIINQLPSTTSIVVVKKLRWLFNLGTAASKGDTTITLGSHISADCLAYITPKSATFDGIYQFGGPGNYEDITVTAAPTAAGVVTLEKPLKKAHPVTEGIWWPLGGLSGNPAWVEEGSDTEEKVNEVIGHEFGHELLDLRDVDALECLMHYSNSRTDQKMRFKELPRYYNPPGGNENQWDCISRP